MQRLPHDISRILRREIYTSLGDLSGLSKPPHGKNVVHFLHGSGVKIERSIVGRIHAPGGDDVEGDILFGEFTCQLANNIA